MVDVSEKDVTARVARASGRVLVSPRVIELLRGEGHDVSIRSFDAGRYERSTPNLGDLAARATG